MWPPAWVHATRPLGILFVTRPLIGQYQVQSRPDDQWEVLYHSVCGGRSFPNTADAFSAGWVEEWKGCVDTGLCFSEGGESSSVILNTASHLSVNTGETQGKKLKIINIGIVASHIFSNRPKHRARRDKFWGLTGWLTRREKGLILILFPVLLIFNSISAVPH